MRPPLLTTLSWFFLIVAHAQKVVGVDRVHTNVANLAQGTTEGNNFFYVMERAGYDPATIMWIGARTIVKILYPNNLYPNSKKPYPFSSIILCVYPFLDTIVELVPFRRPQKEALLWFSARHVEFMRGCMGDMAREVEGLLLHEMVLGMVNRGGGTIPVGLLTGIIDLIRMKAGYIDENWKPVKSGDKWDEGYERTAYFLGYLNKHWPGSVAALNAFLENNFYDNHIFGTIFGRTVEMLWEGYKQAPLRDLHDL